MRNCACSKLVFVLILLPALLIAQAGQLVTSRKGMVVTAEPLASKVGKEILEQGGNAVDAAVAVGFALSVTYPVAGNIGGGGFLVAHLADGRNIAIDYREKAPGKAFRDMYLDSTGKPIVDLSLYGALASGVPGSVSGLLYALKKYGTLPLQKVIAPAIRLAKEGFKLSSSQASSFAHYSKDFLRFPTSAAVFLKQGKELYKEGELFKQPDLAHTLELISQHGSDGFYKGETADKIVRQMQLSGGIISLEDLSGYSAVERTPLTGSYKGYSVISMPPSSSGGTTLLEMLNILEHTDLAKQGFGSAEHIHNLVSAMKFAYADRSEYLGDPDYFNVPVAQLTSKDYAGSLYKRITDKAIPSSDIKPGLQKSNKESHQTTHYSVCDSSGNLVSITTTINSGYGSLLVVGGAGFLLNNEMDDFSVKPGHPNQFGLLGGEANSIQPGKRMLSSMTPTIVLKENKPVLVLGTPGGSTIITAVLQVLLNCIEFKMSLKDAMFAPRLHHQWYPDEINFEPDGYKQEVKNSLVKMGYKIGKDRRLGLIEAIYWNPAGNIIEGMSDPRGSGSAEGL